MKIKSLFLFFILNLLSGKFKSEITMKFKRQNKFNEFENLIHVNFQCFGDYFIKNKYTTDVYIGEPPQKIPAYLNPTQSGAYLTDSFCPIKEVYDYQSSKNYKLIEKKTYSSAIIHRFSDTLYYDFNGITNNKKYDEYEFLTNTELNKSICFNIGIKLIGFGELVEDNLLYRLHKYKSIKSYYFTIDIDKNKKDEMNFIFDIDINNNEKGYTFIKASSYTKDKRQYLAWGLDFDSLKLNNRIIYEKQFRSEFNFNLECIIGSSSFKEAFDLFLKEKNIMEIKQNYDNKYDIYIFNNINDYNLLKDLTISFYHKSLDYYFTLDFHDLFYEKDGRLYFLIIFNSDKQDYWEFGSPFLKKYKFIYNQDIKFIGFINDKKGQSFNDNNNNDKTNLKTIIIIIALVLILIIIGTLLFGFLIGKKMYKVRKSKTNELLELYDYNAQSK